MPAGSCKQKGFTLIELLVVVLIIGILSSVALPQYKNAVERARFTEAETMVSQSKKLFTMYFLENGGYPATAVYFSGNNPEPSSIELPNLTPYNSYVSYSKFFQYWVSCSNQNCFIAISRLSTPGAASGNSDIGVVYHMQFYYYLENGTQKNYFYNKSGDKIGNYMKNYLLSKGMVFESA